MGGTGGLDDAVRIAGQAWAPALRCGDDAARALHAALVRVVAIAIAMVGTPIALSLGVPLGTWLGTPVGWRTEFGIVSLLTLALIVWVQAKVFDYLGQSSREPFKALPPKILE